MATSFPRPSLGTIIARLSTALNTRLPGLDSLIQGSFGYVMARVLAGAVHSLYGYAEWIADQVFVDQASGDSLDRHAAIWGLSRLPASKASGNVTFTGTPTTVIPAGTKVITANGIELETDALHTMATASDDVACTAVVAGAAGNLAAGVKVTLVTPISGIDSTATVASGGTTGGADIETDAALRTRIVARIQAAPQGGALADYTTWAKTVSGVAEVWVFPGESGAGTVAVRFAVTGSDAARIPSGAKVTEVQTAIDAKRPVTADVTVSAPTDRTVNHTIALTPNNATVQAAVQTEVKALYVRDGGPGTTIRNSRIREAISIATGESYHTLSDVDGDGTGDSDVVSTSSQLVRPTFTFV